MVLSLVRNTKNIFPEEAAQILVSMTSAQLMTSADATNKLSFPFDARTRRNSGRKMAASRDNQRGRAGIVDGDEEDEELRSESVDAALLEAMAPESEGEEGEDDDDEAATECLFAQETAPSPRAALAVDQKLLGFDLLAWQRRHRLGLYSRIRMVNYIRRQVAANTCFLDGSAHSSRAALLAYMQEGKLFSHEEAILSPALLSLFRTDDSLLVPFLPEDPLLCAVTGGDDEGDVDDDGDDDDDESDGGDGDGRSKGGALGVQTEEDSALQARIAALKAKLSETYQLSDAHSQQVHLPQV